MKPPSTHNTLIETQKNFYKHLRREHREAILNEIIPGGTLDVLSAMQVYRDNYTARLTDQLGEVYEAVWWVLGDEDFFTLSSQYIHDTESTSYNMWLFAQNFVSFISHQKKMNEAPFLSELARFEWDFHKLFHQRQHLSLAATHLPGFVDDQDILLVFGSAHFLFDSPFKVYDIWNSRKGSTNIPIDWNSAQTMLMYKQNGQIFAKKLEANEKSLFSSLKEGVSLQKAVEQAAESFPSLESHDLTKFFKFLMQSGLIEKIRPLS